MIAHFDLIGGASGGMLLGALLDAGAELPSVEATVRTVVAKGWTFDRSRVNRSGISATYVRVVVAQDKLRPSGRHETKLADLQERIRKSALPRSQQEVACKIYQRLAEAEARVHGLPSHDVHFHEVGELDALIEILGIVSALEILEIKTLSASSIPCGIGTITTEHGLFPNPSPATMELLRGMPTHQVDEWFELVTPTAAAAIAAVCSSFGHFPKMTIRQVGYGAGTATLRIPNVTRVYLGSPAEFPPADDLSVLEANIDDMSPQHYELAVERIFDSGAIDVWLTPVIMKKLRPATLLSALVPIKREQECAQTILRETTTIGVRVRRVDYRYTMLRTISTVETPWGTVRVKESTLNGVRRRRVEYDDVVAIARAMRLGIGEVTSIIDRYVQGEKQ